MRGLPSRRLSALVAAMFAVTLAGCTPAEEATEPAPSDGTPTHQPTSAPTSAATVHFTASGDFAATPATEAVLSDIAASGSDLHLALGDLSYGRAGEEGRWCDFVTERLGGSFPFELLAGNHESDGKNGHIDRFADCLPNRLPGLAGEYGRQYFVDVPQDDPLVRILLLSPGVPFDDGVDEYAEGSRAYDWTATAIDEARHAGIPWVVVGMHMPCLTVGRYGCRSGADVMNLLVEKRVDLVMSGHEHNYSRTHLLSTGPGCPRIRPDRFEGDCVADRDSDFEQGAGTVFVIAGTGGVGLRDINRSDSEWDYMAAVSGLNERPTWGSISVQLTPDRLAAEFDPAVGEKFTDSFSLESSRAG
jgi:hypothetical protein